MNFLIFRSSDHVLLRHYSGPEETGEAQAQDGEYAVECPEGFSLESGWNYTRDPETDAISGSADVGVLRALAIQEMRQACDAAIASGFTSAALGSDKHYPAAAIDQANMQRVAIASGALWCCASDAWSFETHSAAQGVQVLSDFGAACDDARDHLADLITQLNAAATADAIAAIAW